MPNATLDALQMEINAHIETIGPAIEGYRDAVRYLSKPEEVTTRQSVEAHVALLQRRLDLAAAANDALAALAMHGFDTVPDLVLAEDQFQVWVENDRTHQAAVERTKSLPPPATGGTFALGDGTDKTS